jgi:hypothetical protein
LAKVIAALPPNNLRLRRFVYHRSEPDWHFRKSRSTLKKGTRGFPNSTITDRVHRLAIPPWRELATASRLRDALYVRSRRSRTRVRGRTRARCPLRRRRSHRWSCSRRRCGRRKIGRCRRRTRWRSRSRSCCRRGRRRWAAANRRKDIHAAPAIDVIWRAGVAALGGTDMHCRVVQRVATSRQLVAQTRICIP